MDLKKLRGRKGCKKCPALLDGLAKALEAEAYHRYQNGADDWERVWEKAIGVRMAIGLLKDGVDKNGNVVAAIGCPPGFDFEAWKKGPRFIPTSGFHERPEDLIRNPEGKPEVKPIVPGPAKKSKERKKSTARKGGFEVLSMEDLKKKRGEE